MRVYDPIYGEFQIKEPILSLVNSPEFRRLSQIRLLNTLTPSLATLGELRRYSHTLGVLRLSEEWYSKNKNHLSGPEFKALQAAIVLHDIATPPFGHLMEYILKEINGWDHETAIIDLIKGWHSPENTAQQIFAGKGLSLLKIIEKSGIDLSILLDILTKKHPAHKLILGSLDFDNIDNIARMTWALGIDNPKDMALGLARSIALDDEGNLLLDRNNIELVRKWSELRKKVYDILVFDMPTVSAQAILSMIIRSSIEDGTIDENDWVMSDEELLHRVKQSEAHPENKELVNRCYLGNLPKPLVCMKINLSLKDIKVNSPRELFNCISSIASELDIKNPVPYVFIDKGTFQKELEFKDQSGIWQFGNTSKSVVIYLFSLSSQEPSAKIALAFRELAVKHLKIDQSKIQHLTTGTENVTNDRQQKLDL